MAGAQDGTFTCVGYMEGTVGPKFNRRHLVTNVYCVCVRYRQRQHGGPPQA